MCVCVWKYEDTYVKHACVRVCVCVCVCVRKHEDTCKTHMCTTLRMPVAVVPSVTPPNEKVTTTTRAAVAVASKAEVFFIHEQQANEV